MTSRVGQEAPASQGSLAQSPLLSAEAIQATAEALHGVAVKTPLVPVPALASRMKVPVFLKCEHLQPVGAFKIRGAYTAISRLAPSDRARGVITYSSGNHGKAVAYAAGRLGIRRVGVMPQRAPGIKVAGVKRLGGEVVIAGNSSVERYEQARRMSEEEGLAMVPPYESLDVIAGQATCGLEILEACPEVKTIVVPVGGGGLIAGIAVAVSAFKPGTRIVAVEPVGAPKLARALEAGRSVQLDHTESLADGLLPLAIGQLPFSVLSGSVPNAVQVTEAEIVEGVRFLYREANLSAEPSGAVTTAAILSGKVEATGPIVAIVSGGNVDPERFQQLVQ